MAARENQGLHIALILFVMMTVMLAVICYFTWTSAAENADKSAQAAADLKDEEDLREAYQIEAELLKMWIGFGSLTEEEAEGQVARLARLDDQVAQEVAQIKDTYDQDMQLFDAAYQGLRNYRELPKELEKTITKKNTTVATGYQNEQDLLAQKDAAVAASQAREAEAEKKYQETLNQANQDKATYRTTSDDIKSQQLQGQTLLTAARSAEQKAVEEATAERTQLTSQIGQLQSTIALKDEKLREYEAEEFDIADGRITDISSRTDIVWINVGFKDNLPPNAVFAVYPRDASQYNSENIKGTVEVRRILGAHLAEAKISNDKINNPILPGDAINTTTWSPGRRLSFAITGFVDIDGDSRSDAARLRNIITRNGGEVVAYIDDSGELIGSIDAKTRYLITGDDFPIGKIEDAVLAKMIKSNTELTNRAQEEGVERKYYDELLEEMGFRGESRIQTINTPADDEFVPRSPPARGDDGSAF